MTQGEPGQNAFGRKDCCVLGLWLVLFGVSVCYGTFLTGWARQMRRAYQEVVPGCQHATLTTLALDCPWWPYGIAVVCLVVLALWGTGFLGRAATLWLAVPLAILEGILLFANLFAYCIPMMQFFGEGS